MPLELTEAGMIASFQSAAVSGLGSTPPFLVVSNPRVPRTRPNHRRHFSVDVSTISSIDQYQRQATNTWEENTIPLLSPTPRARRFRR
jgi:hypothetical protein